MEFLIVIIVLVILIALFTMLGLGINFLYVKLFKKTVFSQKKKKMFWISLATLVVAFIVNINLVNMHNSSASQSAESSSEYKTSDTDESMDTSVDESVVSSIKAESKEPVKPESYRTDITYEKLARTPDDYIDTKVQMTGKVLQVQNDDDTTHLRVAINGDYDSIVLLEIDNSDLDKSRILEDDLITFYGTSSDLATYESTSGQKITIPAILADKIDNQGKASDDYGFN